MKRLAAILLLVCGSAVNASAEQPTAVFQAPAGIERIHWFKTPRKLPAIGVTGPAGTQSIYEHLSKLNLIVLWGSWCHACSHEMPSLDRLQANFTKDQLKVIPIAIYDKLFASKSFYRHHHIRHLPNFTAKDTAAWEATTLAGQYPTTLIVRQDGQWLGRQIGALDWNTEAMLSVLNQLLEN